MAKQSRDTHQHGLRLHRTPPFLPHPYPPDHTPTLKALLNNPPPTLANTHTDLEGSSEPLVEGLGAGEHLGQQEVEQRPQLGQRVLDGRAWVCTQ